MRKTLALIMVLVMLFALCGCGQNAANSSNTNAAPASGSAGTAGSNSSSTGKAEDTGASNPADTGSEAAANPDSGRWNLEGTIFPLAEKTTFTVLTAGYRNASFEDLQKNEDWKSFCDALNVEFDFVYLGEYDDAATRDALQMRLVGGEYGDAIMSVYLDTLNITDIQDLAEAGMVISLDQYMSNPNVMPNFYQSIYSSHPDIYNNMKSNDGNTYYFAGCSEINAYTANEALMQVNSEWLKQWKEARGVDHTPQTLAEFEDMLDFFKNADLNGNGEADEIPYFIAQGTYAGCMTLEHAMGMYGIATKDSTADMDIMIDDNGKCDFVYTTDTYKTALKQFADWYQKGYIWEEAFTGNSETITNYVSNAANCMGVFNACENIKGFEPLLPPTIEGFHARYHMHPSVRLGVRQPYAVITDKCEHPEIFAAVMDVLYNFDNYFLWNQGSENLDRGAVVKENGKYTFHNDVERATAPEEKSIFAFLGRMEVDTLDNFSNYVNIDSYFGEQQRVKGYILYEDAGIWNPTGNLWPRCSLDSKYAEDYAFLYTDVSTAVAEYRAKFVTGLLDVDKEWDAFQEKLKTLGVDQMRMIIQETYDNFVNK